MAARRAQIGAKLLHYRERDPLLRPGSPASPQIAPIKRRSGHFGRRHRSHKVGTPDLKFAKTQPSRLQLFAETKPEQPDSEIAHGGILP